MDLLLTIPVWVRFPGLNFAHWNTTSISKIANTIGKPSMMDEHMKYRRRLAYARVLVEIEAGQAFGREMMVKLPNQEPYVQEVEYEHIPPFVIIVISLDIKLTNAQSHSKNSGCLRTKMTQH